MAFAAAGDKVPDKVRQSDARRTAAKAAAEAIKAQAAKAAEKPAK